MNAPRTINYFAVAFIATVFLTSCQNMVDDPLMPNGPFATNPPPAGATRTNPVLTEGLSSYKVYSTTKSLCADACELEESCVTHSFEPISTINGYVAGQCEFFGQS
jgi:hypothetical protein